MSKSKGFTLIELLVVISVIALLMALLLPTLQRVGRQAKAVVCQSNLRQWGVAFSTFTSERDDKFKFFVAEGWYNFLLSDTKRVDSLLCPMARKHKERPDDPGVLAGIPYGLRFGGKSSAWMDVFPGRANIYGSYGINDFIRDDRDNSLNPYFWRTCNVRNAANVPVYLDCISSGKLVLARDRPPEYNDALGSDMSYFCINRHDGGINSLFMDWSVRKAGLKELWTLKWHRLYYTAGLWTRAGGAMPEDWPQWMRRFRDY